MRPELRLQCFARSDSGAVAVIWAMMLVVFFGFIALIFDIGRVAVTQSELQSFADHVAVAAAGELNGEPDAIDRATRAVEELIADSQTFGAGTRELSGAVDVIAPVYYRGLADDFLPRATYWSEMAKLETTDPARAQYVRVSVIPRSVTMPFYNALLGLIATGGDVSANPGAVAIAGSESLLCDVTPLFFCAPAGRDLTMPSEIGTMIRLRTGGSGASWAPGNFGFLDPDGAADIDGVCADVIGKGRSQVTNCLVGAEISRTQCVSRRSLDLSPGQQVGITNAAFNYRFDIFAKSDKERNDLRFPPAANVVSGLTPEADGCHKNNPTQATATTELPPDSCLTAASGSCAPFGPTGGTWDAQKPAYIATNHPKGGLPDVSAADFALPVGFDFSSISGTRFETYLQEIKLGSGRPLGRILGDATSTFRETGVRQCSSTPSSSDPFRRVVTAAIVDCVGNDIRGNDRDVPAIGFVQVFLTEPVGMDPAPGGNFDIFGEVIGSAGTGGGGAAEAGGIARVVVRLVR